jgi:hypothetical protein
VTGPEPGAQLAHDGWCRVPADAAARSWAAGALSLARAALSGVQADQWRCGATWCVGLDLLPNGPAGHLPDGTPPPEEALRLAWAHLGRAPAALHPAQVSVLRPGYPRHGPEDSAAAFRYRLERDAAHVDGLLPCGPARRRHLREAHGFILGIGLTAGGTGQGPLVVWNGSHRVLGAAFAEALAGLDANAIAATDLTETYQTARRAVFTSCDRVPVALAPGEAVLLHRHCLHGIAPWPADIPAIDPSGFRMTAYFRPAPFEDLREWVPDQSLGT